MIIGNVYCTASNGEESIKLTGVTFANKAEVANYENEKLLTTGFPHRVEILREVTDEEAVSENNADDEVDSGNVLEFPEEESNENSFPPVWWRRNEFVARDGRVFHSGKEKKDLYRTLPPSEY